MNRKRRIRGKNEVKQKNKETERHEGRRRDGERWKDEAGETGDSRKKIAGSEKQELMKFQKEIKLK